MSDRLRAELRRALDDGGAGAAAARVALGDGPLPQRLEAGIRALAERRGPGSSTCPSDAARAVGGERWRDLLDCARDIARRLAQRGEVQITQRGVVLDPHGAWRGPVRIRTTRSDR
ncbi:hypothetical protein CRI77_09230 [Mycolicibacterium duvalii]|uniref:DUF3253 domain-containing protein n=1 Tax=Mycolicibacterium duvalii TaxID=39688 RepID=UPI000BEEE972|nr:DUF3253 domain-containing protein [Mycolicibacterium duvalii]MCV7369584.1 DUF3253 domain-containing protein [Mycolicibacterium duvalii]PEG42208.1 hypothetical protein CRI77_09230 [Mycolicibacterium duvalii]